ncbi:MAG: lipoyl(octanoyl) transferase LipB [Planctomycetota bacterium]
MHEHALEVIDLGRSAYAEAYAEQHRHHADVLASRDAGGPLLGRILTVEHDPVITVTKKARQAGHVLASPELLDRTGIELHDTDRGGDVTYHGPGQLVVYPILDLKRLKLGLHDHMRLMEDAVIGALRSFGIEGHRDADATGVWVGEPIEQAAKVCAMGVRVRRWVTMHGLALNVATDLSHFDHIVPCGLAGRPVTSIQKLTGRADLMEARDAVISSLLERLGPLAAEIPAT